MTIILNFSLQANLVEITTENTQNVYDISWTGKVNDKGDKVSEFISCSQKLCAFYDCNLSSKTCTYQADKSHTEATLHQKQVYPAGQNKVALVIDTSPRKINIWTTQAKLIERTITTAEGLLNEPINTVLFDETDIFIGYTSGKIHKIHDTTSTSLFTISGTKFPIQFHKRETDLIVFSPDSIDIYSTASSSTTSSIAKNANGNNQQFVWSCLSYDGNQLYLLKKTNKLNIHTYAAGYAYVSEVDLISITTTLFKSIFAVNKEHIVANISNKVYLINIATPAQKAVVTTINTLTNFSNMIFFQQQPFFPLFVWQSTKIVVVDIMAEFCATGTYNIKADNTGECLLCHQTCWHCQDTDQYSCTSCDTSTSQFRSDDVYNSKTCPCVDYYGNNIDGTSKPCVKCDVILTGGFTKPLVGAIPLDDSCIQCQYDLAATNQGTQCIKCKGRRDPADDCNCPINTVSDGTHTCNCISDHIETFNKYGKFIGCKCAAGKFTNISNACIDCGTGCIECTSATTCVQCKANFRLKNDKSCECIPTFALTGNDCLCVLNSTLSYSKCECNENYFYDAQLNECKATCQSGFYAQTQLKICKICPVDCVECRGFYDCQKCTNNKVLSDLQCKTTCIEGQLLQDGICMACVPFCQQCKDLQSCDKCKDGRIVSNKDGQCVTNCNDGFYKNINETGNLQCLQCSSECKSCESDIKCLACNEDWLLQNDICTQKCGLGKVPDEDKTVCEPCSFTSEYEMCGGLISGELQLSVSESEVFYFVFNRKVIFSQEIIFSNYFDILIEDLNKDKYQLQYSLINDQVVKFTIKFEEKWYHESKLYFKLNHVDKITGLEDTTLLASYDLHTTGKKTILNPYWNAEIQEYLGLFQMLELVYFMINTIMVILYLCNLTKTAIFFFGYTQTIGAFIFLNQYMPFTTLSCLKAFSMFTQLNLWPSFGHENQYSRFFKNHNNFQGQFYFGTQSIFQDLFTREYSRLDINTFYFFNGIAFSYYIILSWIIVAIIQVLYNRQMRKNKFASNWLVKVRNLFYLGFVLAIHIILAGPIAITSVLQFKIYSEETFLNSMSFFFAGISLLYIIIFLRIIQTFIKSHFSKETINEQNETLIQYKPVLGISDNKYNDFSKQLALVVLMKTIISIIVLANYSQRNMFALFCVILINITFLVFVQIRQTFQFFMKKLTVIISEVSVILICCLFIVIDSNYIKQMYGYKGGQVNDDKLFATSNFISMLIVLLINLIIVINIVNCIFEIAGLYRNKQSKQSISHNIGQEFEEQQIKHAEKDDKNDEEKISKFDSKIDEAMVKINSKNSIQSKQQVQDKFTDFNNHEKEEQIQNLEDLDKMESAKSNNYQDQDDQFSSSKKDDSKEKNSIVL